MNRFLAYALEALDAIWRNRARSILTMLGLIVGTASVIAVLGIGQAASGGIQATLGSFGDPGFLFHVDPNQDDPTAAQLQYRDAAAVLAENPGSLEHVYANFERTYHVKANGVDYITSVESAPPVAFDTLTLHAGRRIGPADVAGGAHVTLLTQSLERRFFGGEALGRIVRIDGVRFRVIGVYDDLKAGIFNTADQSDYCEIPESTFHEIAPGPVDSLRVYPKNGVALDEVREAVTASLRRIHGPRAQYQIQDVLAFLGAFEKTIQVVAYGLTAIGGVALLVAGIGVMNIMLVSVTERTREIGIRKAIGGSSADITLQFLMEAVILSLLGGGAGMLLGIAFVVLAYGVVQSYLGPAPIPWAIVVFVAVGFSTLVGIVFGTYPAVRAGKLDPIEALRS
ncbi:MAG: ABC transporter permease [Candidatus Eremiobacteraeota bacterium]|nr:ABC transporter permease [Candidatus Eremiobacteraeota bacterium]